MDSEWDARRVVRAMLDPAPCITPWPTSSRAQPDAAMGDATTPPSPVLQDAYTAIYEAGVVVEILLDMAAADIGGTRTVQGPSVEYLATQLRAALERIEPALSALR